MTRKKVTIIGSGPAAYTAAIYCARYNIETIVIGDLPGGQLATTTDVENYPGFISVLGPDLMNKIQDHVKHYDAKVVDGYVGKVNQVENGFECYAGEKKYTSDAVIITTGASAKWLGIESEQYFRGYGVSACATCDGFFFKNKRVAVVGGGNTAAEEALFLTSYASEVFLIHRRESLRADEVLQEKLKNNKKISIIWNSTVSEVIGDKNPKNVTGIRIKNSILEREENIQIDGLFVAIGHSPNTSFVKDILDLDKFGYIKTETNRTLTNVPGIFAAGDVMDSFYRQAITSAGYGCMAAIDCKKFFEEFS